MDRADALIDELNGLLGEYTPFKLALVDPAKLIPLEKNAHYMPKRMLDQLTANVQGDGNLFSVPGCWRRPDGEMVVLTGNHRVLAAKQAGIKKIIVMYTDASLTRSEQVSIQLSHNSIFGKDNPKTLMELWGELTEIDDKLYSGLDETIIGAIDSAMIARPTDVPLLIEEITLSFVADEADRFDDIVKRLSRVGRRYVGDYAQFERFFNLLLDCKEELAIVSTATAFAVMMDFMEEWLDAREKAKDEPEQIDAEQAEGLLV